MSKKIDNENISNKAIIFASENPIESSEDDFLGRKKYTDNLAKVITNWKEEDSLVIALDGEWGSGKTSLIKLTLKEIRKNYLDINIIEFNPWMFSETDNLLDGFIKELSIGLKGKIKQDKKLIKYLKYYSELLSLLPRKDELKSLLDNIFIISIISGITFLQVIEFFNNIPDIINITILILFILLLVSRVFLSKVLEFFRVYHKFKEKSIFDIKNDIINILKKEKRKLLIIIDDIDRLTEVEIKQLFRIIRVNADFPNTLYLLAYDRKIIEENLNVQGNISGREYLEKIVQVNITLPSISKEVISNYLLKEIEETLNHFPSSINKYFEDKAYFSYIYHFGIKDFFCNIREIKRYINSLKFNLLNVIQDNEIEVNPIDFIAIEVLRVFEPKFYSFLSMNRNLFAENEEFVVDKKTFIDDQKKYMLSSFDKFVSEKNRKNVEKLIFELFPQAKKYAGLPGISFGYASNNWSQELRICSNKYFYSYFNFIPGGEKEEISMLELTKISIICSDYNALTQLLDNYKENGRFEKFITKMLDFVSHDDLFNKEYDNIILALFNSFLNLPKIEVQFFKMNLDFMIASIVYKLLDKNSDLEKNYEILKQSVYNSKSIYGPVYFFYYELKKEHEKNPSVPAIIPLGKMQEMKQICIEKINSNKYDLLDESELPFILLRWREWSDNSEGIKNYIAEVIQNDVLFLKFFSKFEGDIHRLAITTTTYRKYYYNELKEFCDLETVKQKILVLKENDDFYKLYKPTIDNFLTNFHKKDNKNISDYE